MKIFPSPVFAWVFLTVLLGMLGMASYEDLRRMVIPKWVTLPMLALGLLFNVVRGVWVAGGAAGAGDGFLWALAGFGAGFGLFLSMWLLGTCGGGDVKLFAALGAWTGALNAVYILIGTLILVALMTVGQSVLGLLGGRPLLAMQAATPARGARSGKKGGSSNPVRSPRQRLLTYSLPVALSSACVLLWVWRVELRLDSERQPAAEQVRVQAQP